MKILAFMVLLAVLAAPSVSFAQQPIPAISVNCTAKPHAARAGGEVQISILAFTGQNAPVPGANVKIQSGGGWFSTSGGTTEVGTTDANGVFRTRWKSPNPAARSYEIVVSVVKDGFAGGEARLMVPIR